jgi:hypothetical protein
MFAAGITEPWANIQPSQIFGVARPPETEPAGTAACECGRSTARVIEWWLASFLLEAFLCG